MLGLWYQWSRNKIEAEPDSRNTLAAVHIRTRGVNAKSRRHMKPVESITRPTLNDHHLKIIEARHHDPFEVLGKHPDENGVEVCVYIPHAVEVSILEGNHSLERIGESDFFR